jgi:ParB-like chromosome segregation protein Spo0J
MDYREIPVESLLLDPMNPRHGVEVEGQEEVINAFLQDRTKAQQDRTKAQHLIQLAKDIAEHGPSPIDLALVVPEDGVYTVVEGNRRVLAMKLLKNPALARGSRIEKAIQEASRHSRTLGDMRCMVAPSREEAKSWFHNVMAGLG